MSELFHPAGSKFRFEALDGLRGIASLIVVLAHFCSVSGVLPQWPGVFNAVIAVDTFFVLSGFVLAHSFLRRQERGLSLAPFGLFVQRWVRLWVPFCVATIIAIGLRYLLGPHVCSNQESLVFTYCQRWNTQDGLGSLVRQLILFYSPNLNAPTWTLPVEFINSLLVPALAFLIVRSPSYILLLSILSLLSIFLPITLPDCLYLFAAGCALRYGVFSKGLEKVAPILLVFSYICMLPSNEISQHITQALMAPASVALVLLSLRTNRISLALLHPVVQILGRLSFPMYLLHWPILLGFVPYVQSKLFNGDSSFLSPIFVSFIIYLPAKFLFSIPFEMFVDTNAVKLGRKLRAAIAF